MPVFCAQVESVLGKKKFLAVYALAGIAGNVLSCVVNPRTPVRDSGGGKREDLARRAVISRPLCCVSLIQDCRTLRTWYLRMARRSLMPLRPLVETQ